jgi:hypothetical protein
MARRQTHVLRNLDDNLKVFNLLTVKSCGLVVLVYAACFAAELVFRLFTLLFGHVGSLAQFGVAGVAVAALAWVERYEDEHYVPSMIDYWRARPWRTLYAGGRADPYAPPSIERVLRGE